MFFVVTSITSIVPLCWFISSHFLVLKNVKTSMFAGYTSHVHLIGGIPTIAYPPEIWKSDWIIIPAIGENKNHVPNHQPVIHFHHVFFVESAVYVARWNSDDFSTWSTTARPWQAATMDQMGTACDPGAELNKRGWLPWFMMVNHS